MFQVFSVSSTDELRTALQTATDDDVIELAPGTYDRLEISRQDGIGFDTPVTIRSADPDAPAVLTGMSLGGVQGLTFEGLTFDYTYTQGDHWLHTSPFAVRNSADITIRDSHFDGDRAIGADPDTVNGTPGYGNGRGLHVRNVDGLTVENNEFEGFARGLQISQIRDGIVSGNEFHNQRMDHLNVAEARNLLIEKNYMHDFDAPPDASDHRDMIQFWTDNTKTQTENIIIRDNVMVLGEGDLHTQSIFMSNRAVTEDGMADMEYKNVQITGNVIVNAHKHGIKGGPYDGLLIANNTILREDAPGIDGILANPRIELDGTSTGVTILDNIVSGISTFNEPEGWALEGSDWQIDGNLFVQDEDRDAPGWYGDVFINPAEGTRSDLANIQLRPDSPLDLEGKGAPVLAYDPTPEVLTALIQSERTEDNWARFDFSSEFSAGPDGPLGDDALYHWDFGNGQTATGPDASYSYSAPGLYTVTLTVTAPDGSIDRTTTRVEVLQPELFELSADGDLPVVFKGAYSTGTGLFVFDDHADKAKIAPDAVAALAGAEDFRLDLSLYSADWASGAGEVLRVHTAFSMAVRPDGSLTFRLSPEGEKQTVLRAEDALRDGDWADISVQFSGGMLRLSIDGVVQDEAPVAGHIGGIEGRGMILGDPFKAEIGFTGQIGALRLSASEHRYASLDPDAPPPQTPPEAPAPPMVFDFDLAEVRQLDPEALTLRGGALFDPAAGALEFAGQDGWAFLDGGAATALGAQTTVSFAYQREIADGAYARLVWNRHNIAVDAKDDGLSLRVGLADGSFKQYRIDDLGLNDTDRHEIMAHVNEETDLVQLIVDDVLVFSSTEDDVQLTRQDGSGASQWMIGGAWTGYFDGTISDLRLGSNPWSLDAEVQMDRFQFDPEPDGWISDLPL